MCVVRSKVPRDPLRPDGPKLNWLDLKIGAKLNIFSRIMVPFKADGFTKNFYKDKGVELGSEFAYVDPGTVQHERQVPPYNGFGSEEDSLSSCTGGIKPTAPKKEFHWDKRGFVLRFNAKLVSSRPEDKNRRFVMQFFLEDDTLAIREPPMRNSGVVGGNFLRRQGLKKPDDDKYGPGDFFVGAVCDINCHKFVLLDADEYTYRLMENDPKTFPLSDFHTIAFKLKEKAEAIRQFFLKENIEKLDFSTMERCLNSYCGLKLKKQQIVGVWRKLDKRGRGHVSYTKLIRLAEKLPLGVTIAGGW